MRATFALPIVATVSLAFATFVLVSVASTPARAFGVRHAFCLTGDEWPGLSNCTFDAYAQCQASSSGRALTCIAIRISPGKATIPTRTKIARARRRRAIPGRDKMRSTCLTLALGMLLLSAPAHAQTYDPNYPVCMQI